MNMISNRVAEVVSSQPIQTLSSTIDSDRDSGVAIELGSINDATSSMFGFYNYRHILYCLTV
jgi:hypothetical protein